MRKNSGHALFLVLCPESSKRLDRWSGRRRIKRSVARRSLVVSIRITTWNEEMAWTGFAGYHPRDLERRLVRLTGRSRGEVKRLIEESGVYQAAAARSD